MNDDLLTQIVWLKNRLLFKYKEDANESESIHILQRLIDNLSTIDNDEILDTIISKYYIEFGLLQDDSKNCIGINLEQQQRIRNNIKCIIRDTVNIHTKPDQNTKLGINFEDQTDEYLYNR